MVKSDALNYPRKLIVRIALLTIMFGTLQEAIRHTIMQENFKALRTIALIYPAETEEQMMIIEEKKRAKISDTVNVSILIIKLSCLIFMLYRYDKKYFNKEIEPE